MITHQDIVAAAKVFNSTKAMFTIESYDAGAITRRVVDGVPLHSVRRNFEDAEMFIVRKSLKDALASLGLCKPEQFVWRGAP